MVLIDSICSYFSYLEHEVVAEELKNKVYFFSCFFFTCLKRANTEKYSCIPTGFHNSATNKELLLIPYNQGRHWSLIVCGISTSVNVLYHLDSLTNHGHQKKEFLGIMETYVNSITNRTCEMQYKRMEVLHFVFLCCILLPPINHLLLKTSHNPLCRCQPKRMGLIVECF